MRVFPTGLLAAGLLVVLGGCQGPLRQQAIDVAAISAVQDDLKRQIAHYAAYARNPRQIPVRRGDTIVETNISELTAPDGGQVWACGTGNIGFDILSVEAELTTTLGSSVGGNLGVTVPLQGVTVGGKVGGGRTVTNTQTLTYNVYPILDDTTELNPTRADVNRYPIAKVLTDLRQALLASATRFDYSFDPPRRRPPTACVTNYNPEKIDAPGGTYTLGLSVVETLSGGVSISLALVELGVDGSRKSTTGHTLHVAFRQEDLTEVKAAYALVDQTCKAPNQDSVDCKAAKAKVGQLTSPNPGTGGSRPGLFSGTLGVESRFRLEDLLRNQPGVARIVRDGGTGMILVVPPAQPAPVRRDRPGVR